MFLCKIFCQTCQSVSSSLLTSVQNRQLGGDSGGGIVSVDQEEAEDDDQTHGEEDPSVEQMFLKTELSQDLGHTPPAQKSSDLKNV